MCRIRRILAAIWETVALFASGRRSGAASSLHAVFVHASLLFLSSLFFLPSFLPSAIPAYLVPLSPCLPAVRDCHLFAEFLNRVTNNRWMRRRWLTRYLSLLSSSVRMTPARISTRFAGARPHPPTLSLLSLFCHESVFVYPNMLALIRWVTKNF